jgi:NAD(P)-dependent dehydrogenase (short-subunit alcohol dehydrogenase family)
MLGALRARCRQYVCVDDPSQLFDLTGRTALVTGASSGLGARFASVLHAAGASVVVSARRAEPLRAVAEQSRATYVEADLATDEGRVAVVDAVRRTHGRLDILVNNAGVCDNGRLEDQSLADLRHVLEVDLVAVIDLCRLAAPLLFLSEQASVINVASIYGLVGSRGPMAAYNASKGGVVNFTRHLAAQWGPRGVRVNALAPGYFPTELTGDLTDRDLVATINQRTALARTPRPDELDGSLLYLASSASSYTTGQTLTVDGGWTAV